MTGNAIKKALEYHLICPKTIEHYGKKVVGLFHDHDQQLDKFIKRAGGRWSGSGKCWYLERDKTLLQKFVSLLCEKSGYRVHGDAE